MLLISCGGGNTTESGTLPPTESPPLNTDIIPPTTPLSLTATDESISSISLNWSNSTDNRLVTGYRIYRDGSKITETSSTVYIDTDLQSSTTYLFTVLAYDAAGNTSKQSKSVTATTKMIVPAEGRPVCEASLGHCYYISVNGNDNSDGAFDTPFKTALPALQQVQPGDYIYFRGGRYDLNNTMVAKVARIYPVASEIPCQVSEIHEGIYCYYDIRSFLGIGDFSGWASNASGFKVADGTVEKPITIKSYPDEKAVLDLNGATTSRSTVQDHIDHNAATIGKSHWIIKDLEMVGGIINMGGDINNITIDNVQVHDVTVHGGDNPGLIRINRGYGSGGPHNIIVKNSILYNLYDRDDPDALWKPVDAQHFGAITTLSREVYERDVTKGGTGKITVINNTFYNVPTHFFFKNPMSGPVLIQNNTLYNAVRVAQLSASNVSFVNNLVVDTPSIFRVSAPGYTADFILDIAGTNERIENNTFVNYKEFFQLYNKTNYVIKNNVFFGLADVAPAVAKWSADRYLLRSDTNNYIYAKNDPELHRIYSDDNCFISQVADFIALRWRSASNKQD